MSIPKTKIERGEEVIFVIKKVYFNNERKPRTHFLSELDRRDINLSAVAKAGGVSCATVWRYAQGYDVKEVTENKIWRGVHRFSVTRGRE